MVEGIVKAAMEGKQVQLMVDVQARLMKKQMDLEKELMSELLKSLGVGNEVDTVG